MMDICIPTFNIDLERRAARTSLIYARYPFHNVSIEVVNARTNQGTVKNLAKLAETAGSDIVVFMHDDVLIREWQWDLRVQKHFDAHPKCGLVGFGGATALGRPDIYQKPYELQDLVRYDFASNLSDAEVHGRRIHKAERSAVLDGFILIFRQECLQDTGAFKWDLPGGHHCYDTVACLEAHKHDWEIWTVPVACRHLGGQTSLSPEYNKWLKAHRTSDAESHRRNHEWVYERYRGVLPVRLI